MRARSQTPSRRAPEERTRVRRETPDGDRRDIEAGAARESRRTDEGRTDDDGRPAERRSTRPTLSAADAAEAGVRLVTALTGREAQGVVSLEPADGGWHVGVEVVEDRRVPSSTDVLAIYEAEIDGRGNLIRYARGRRYARGKGEGIAPT